MKNIFGNRLKELRTEKDITGEDLGKILNVTKAAISNWESGNRSPDSNTVIKIADFFDVSLDYLYGKTDSKHNIPKGKVDEDVEKLAKILLQLDKKEQKKIMNYIDITLSEIQSNQKE